MTASIASKSARIIVVEPGTVVRQVIVDALRASGYSAVQGVATGKDALGILEVEAIDWVVTPLLADQPVNAFHLLRLCSEHVTLKDVRVTLLLDESERDCLVSAFELGLFSWTTRPATKESLQAHFDDVAAKIEAHRGRDTLVAAAYLRDELVGTKRFELLLDLEMNLLQLYPGSTELLMTVAEAHLRLGSADKARATLAQAKLLDDGTTRESDELLKRYLGSAGDEPATAPGAGVNVLGLQTCVIVDPDETIRRSLAEILTGVGVAKVESFGDGEEAWQWLKDNPEPSLVIQEWRVPRLTGPRLLQRLRHHGLVSVPIIVLSSLLKSDDATLVREMGVSQVMSKPFDRGGLLRAIVWTIQQDRLPTEHASMERKLHSLLAAGKRDEAHALKETFLRDPSIAVGRKRLVEAEVAHADGRFVEARDLALEAFKLSGSSVAVLNLLARCLMKLRDFGAAVKFFEKARTVSPLNLERLCALAEARSELGDHDAAASAVSMAANLDAGSVLVKETDAKCALARGDTERAKELMSQLESFEGMIAYLNNRAVAYARAGMVDEGISLYRKALKALPDSQQERRAVVLYNKGLAHARNGELEEASIQLQRSLKIEASPVVGKVRSLLKRVESSISKGSPIVLRDGDAGRGQASADDQDAPSSSSEGPVESGEHRAIIAAVQIRRGELCCYLVFANVEPRPSAVKALLANPPRFFRREAISRAEALGAERLLKSGG